MSKCGPGPVRRGVARTRISSVGYGNVFVPRSSCHYEVSAGALRKRSGVRELRFGGRTGLRDLTHHHHAPIDS